MDSRLAPVEQDLFDGRGTALYGDALRPEVALCRGVETEQRRTHTHTHIHTHDAACPFLRFTVLKRRQYQKRKVGDGKLSVPSKGRLAIY